MERRAGAGMKTGAGDGEIAETVQLSNKPCPRYYQGARYDDQSQTGLEKYPLGLKLRFSKPCGCPPRQCWYDAQLDRRAYVLPALTPEEWLRQMGPLCEECGLPIEDYSKTLKVEIGHHTTCPRYVGIDSCREEGP